MRFWFSLCLLLLVSPAWAADLKPLQSPLDKAMQKLAALSGFSCQFEQIIFFGDGSKQQYYGTLAVADGRRFRWQYSQPYEQLYISNGHGIWLYEADLMQAQWLQSLDAIDPVVMRLLSGSVKSSEVHVLEHLPESYHVRIGEAARATELWIALNTQGLPKWFESRDALGHRNRMRLLSIQTKPLDLQQFEFKIPEGVDVIDAEGQIMEMK